MLEMSSRNFSMPEIALQIDPRDNVLVALASLPAGTTVHYGHPPASGTCPVTQGIPAKHKLERRREELEEELGYGRSQNSYRQYVRGLVQQRTSGGGHRTEDALTASRADRVFPNLDGIRFLTHHGGCGGTRQDAQELCGLLAGYIHHPNVAGATVLSLGCQNAQASMLMEEVRLRDPQMTKPVLVFDQQKSGRESALMSRALDETFAALELANQS